MSDKQANGFVFVLAPLLTMATVSALAQVTPAALPERPEVQVTATGAPYDASSTPAAIEILDIDALRDEQANAALTEKLGFVPGVLARQRENFADADHVSIRGFGAHATIGIRGVRVFLDGVPATMPDGQGQLSHVNMSSLGRIEVLRGPFAALYGNVAGGVIHAFTADGRDRPGAGVDLRQDGYTQRTAMSLGGGGARSDYRIDTSRLHSDGYREHSRADRDSLNGKFDFDLGDRRRLRLVFNQLSLPDAEDPLGLRADEMADDPRQAAPMALAFGTRKSVKQAQVGALLEIPTADDDFLRWMFYSGDRRVTQFLAIPVAAQTNPLNGGGVVGLRSPYRGMDLRWEHHSQVRQSPFDLVIGVSLDRQDERLRGYENFAGDQLGVQGRLRRDEDDRVSSEGHYVNFGWLPSRNWYLYGGFRRTWVRFRSQDLFVTTANPDDSGGVDYFGSSVVFGANLRLRPGLHVYASVGRGMQTPTFDELAYRPDGRAGLNFELQPSRSHSHELGAKFDGADGANAEIVLFRANTTDELAVASNSDGRSTFRNVGRALRQGVEVSASLPFGERWRLQLAYTRLQAIYLDDYYMCAAGSCGESSILVPSGTAIPGLPRSTLDLSARFGGEIGWFGRINARALSSVPVAASNGQRAPGFAVFGASLGYAFDRPRYAGRTFVSLENAFDRQYAGSVIVNEGDARYFEPAPGRALLMGLEIRWP